MTTFADIDLINAGTLIVTALVLVVTAAATALNFFLYVSATSPEVIVYAEQDKSSPNTLLLIIENIGKGPAEAVRFISDRPIPIHAFGFTEKDAARRQPRFMTDGALINGIPFLPPGGKRIITWGQYGGISAAFGHSVVGITAEFTARHFRGLKESRTSSTSYLDVDSFIECDASDDFYKAANLDTLQSIARSLEQLAKRSGKSAS